MQQGKGGIYENTTQKSANWKSLFLFVASMGPGLTAMLADTDAGSIVTAAQSGAQWGYKLLALQLIASRSNFILCTRTNDSDRYYHEKRPWPAHSRRIWRKMGMVFCGNPTIGSDWSAHHGIFRYCRRRAAFWSFQMGDCAVDCRHLDLNFLYGQV